MATRVRGLTLLLPMVILGVVVSVVVDLDAIKALIGSPEIRAAIKVAALTFSAGAGVFSYVRSELRHSESSLEQERKEALKRLEETLASAVQHLFAGEAMETIRANVMTVSGEELRMLASVNMLVFPDHKLRLRKGQGCAGSVWEKAVAGSLEDFWKPVYATEAQLTAALLKEKWKLTEAQIGLTRHILWILSIPLFHTSGGKRTFIGVLNFDGVHRPLEQAARLSQPDFFGRCVAVGERVAETVAVLSMFHLG